MDWATRHRAIRLHESDEDVHIIQNSDMNIRSIRHKTKTYCGIYISASVDELTENDVNCHACVTELERRQAYWREIWTSHEGKEVIKILSGRSRCEKELRELKKDIDTLEQELDDLNNLITDCMKHQQPVFTLELPDDVLLSLVEFGSVGEVLLCFKLGDDTRQDLVTRLGKEGFALLGSRLISKGLLNADDPIFNRKWF